MKSPSRRAGWRVSACAMCLLLAGALAGDTAPGPHASAALQEAHHAMKTLRAGRVLVDAPADAMVSIGAAVVDGIDIARPGASVQGEK